MDSQKDFDENPEHIPTEEELRKVVVGPSADEVELTNKILLEGLVPSAQSIVHIAKYSKNDRLRLDASKYVVERNLGKVADASSKKDEWRELIDAISKPADS